MRSFLFFLLIAALVGSGGYYFLYKSPSSEIEYSTEKGEIAPLNEWKNILPGKWKLNTEFRDSEEITIFIGDIEFYPDGTFERHVSILVYVSLYSDAAVEEEEEELCVKAGGVARGKWEIDDSKNNWYEKVTYCNIIQTFIGAHNCNKKYNGCAWFPKDHKQKYGDGIGDMGKKEVKLFTKDKIVIEGKDFSTNGTKRWILEKND